MSINYIKGILKRRYDHIKIVNQDEAEEYKPCMVIYKENMPGIAFCITLDAIWKYIEPQTPWALTCTRTLNQITSVKGGGEKER